VLTAVTKFLVSFAEVVGMERNLATTELKLALYLMAKTWLRAPARLDQAVAGRTARRVFAGRRAIHA